MRPAAAFVAAAIAVAAGVGVGLLGASMLVQRVVDQSVERVDRWTLRAATDDDSGAPALIRRTAALSDGLTPLPPDELMAFVTDVDTDNRPLAGRSVYVMHFDKVNTPPVDAFWSLGAVDGNDRFADNPLDRYSITSRTPELMIAADGSLDIVISVSPPDDPRANWLPAPPGSFTLVLRAYEPRPALQEGRWRPPRLERRERAA